MELTASPVLEIASGDIVEIEAVTHHAGDAPDAAVDDVVIQGVVSAPERSAQMDGNGSSEGHLFGFWLEDQVPGFLAQIERAGTEDRSLVRVQNQHFCLHDPRVGGQIGRKTIHGYYIGFVFSEQHSESLDTDGPDHLLENADQTDDPATASAMSSSHTISPEASPSEASSAGFHDDADDDHWANRRLCPDGNCIGVIGPDGRCKECGRLDEGR